MLFALFFLMLSGSFREKIGNAIGTVSHLVNVYQPLSYFVLAGFGAAAMIAYLLMVRWPQRPEADNPLLQYRREHPDMMD
jgi:hypothetical protein